MVGRVICFGSVLLGLFGVNPQLAQAQASPPGAPLEGYGSADGYISEGYSVTEAGKARTGKRVWTFVPDVLRDGASAPVVVFLHGWTAYLPEYYILHIEHLLAQGLIVIYPQYQRSGVVGLLSDNDQTQYLSRAVAGVEAALDDLGSRADRSQLTATGHSLGGLLTLCWNSAAPSRAQQLLMVHAAYTDEGIPDQVPITTIDWQACAEAVDVPAFILAGDADPLAPEALLAYDAMVNAPQKQVYLALTDSHGSPEILPAHGAPLAVGTLDTLDYRFYFAGLDAVIQGEADLPFDMGLWSDGTPVISPLLWASP